MSESLELQRMDESGTTPLSPSVSYPAVDRSWQAYVFLLSSFTIDTFIWGLNFSYGTFQAFYISHPPFASASPVELAAIGTTSIALGYAEMLFGILLCRRYPHLVKRGVWICLFIYAGSLIIASFCSKVWQLILFQGIICGSSGGFVYGPIYIYLSDWFVERRSLAGGIVFSGAGLGGFVFPLIINSLFPLVGFRWTLRIFALLSFVCCGAALFGMNPRIPPAKPVKGANRQTPILWRSFVTDPGFILLSITTFLQGFLYSPLSVYLPSYTKSFASPLVASFTLSVVNASSVLGQIGTGALCDRFKYTYVMFASALISSIAVLALLRVSDTTAKIMGFAVFIGATAGGFSSTWFPSCIDVAGKETHQAGPIFGWLSLVRGVAAILGPIAAGVLYDPRSNEWSSFGHFGLGKFVVFCGSMGLATAGGCVLVETSRRRRKQS